jgi:hypothetical protein
MHHRRCTVDCAALAPQDVGSSAIFRNGLSGVQYVRKQDGWRQSFSLSYRWDAVSDDDRSHQTKNHAALGRQGPGVHAGEGVEPHLVRRTRKQLEPDKRHPWVAELRGRHKAEWRGALQHTGTLVVRVWRLQVSAPTALSLIPSPMRLVRLLARGVRTETTFHGLSPWS